MKIDSSVGLFDILSLKLISIFEFKSTRVEKGSGDTEITSGGVVSTGPPGGIPSLAQCKDDRIKKSEAKATDFFEFINFQVPESFSGTEKVPLSDRRLTLKGSDSSLEGSVDASAFGNADDT
jgi:hypothetical protein